MTALLVLVMAGSALAAEPCAEGSERRGEVLREFLWRLAAAENRLGYERMKAAHGTVDITEHAITTDSIEQMAQYPKPMTLGAYPYDQVARNGGLFLPDGVSYNATICLGEGGEVDTRWFLHGYLGGGLIKEAGGTLYNIGQGYGGSEAGRRNAALNMKSLHAGKEWHARDKNLAMFARTMLRGLGVKATPPEDGRHDLWQTHRPLEASALAEAIRRAVPEVSVSVAPDGLGRFVLTGVVRGEKLRARVRAAARNAAAPKFIDDRFTDEAPAAPTSGWPEGLPQPGQEERRPGHPTVSH